MVGSLFFPPIGTAAGAVGLGIYGAVTGDVPLAGSRSGSRPRSESEAEDEMEREIEKEMAKQDELEAEIEAELKRQEDLLKQIERDEKLREAEQSQAGGSEVAASTDPREAPRPPQERELPASIFDKKPRQVAKGEWGNDKPIDVVASSLDADRDGAPEEVRYHDEKTGVILRKEEDRDYDGRIDTWVRYDAGLVVEIDRDTDGDGTLDEWQSYGRDGRMARREVDRNGDGTRDAFFDYQAGSLVEERHDGNSDGKLDRVVHYAERKITHTEEDLDNDGRMDTWTYFDSAGGRELVSRVERDANGDGKPDTFETYEQLAGKPSLKERTEDKNGDGEIDVRSVYENGKLKQREISDPTLTPL
jgi:antitoxin component YwqK of YwqJK toxin-antitoxin module